MQGWHAMPTIARYTLLEALRNRLVWLFGLVALLVLGLGGLLQQLALTESGQIQLALMAPALRLAAVFLLAAFVISSQLREANDKGLEMLLALPLPRAVYLLGKLGGYAALALLPALLFGALLGTMMLVAGSAAGGALPAAAAVVPGPGAAALWSLSLWCELVLVAAFSLLCALGLGQLLPALAASAAFYVLARGMAGLQLIGGAALQHDAGPLQRTLSAGLDLIAAVLPRLDLYTRTEWLLYHGADSGALLLVLGQSAVYLALLVGAALFDLYRKAI